MLSHEQIDLQTVDDYSQKIAMRLRAVRKEGGFKTEKSFAEKYSIPLTTYSQHETGKRKIPVETLVGYCKKLSANIGWVLTGVGEPWEKTRQIETSCTAIQAHVPLRIPRENLDMLKQVFLSAQTFLADDQLSFSEWIDRCFEIGVTLPTQKIEDEKIEHIVRLVFSKLA